MMSLIPLLISLLSAGTDVLPLVLRILESYLLLDAASVLQVGSLLRPQLSHLPTDCSSSISFVVLISLQLSNIYWEILNLKRSK